MEYSIIAGLTLCSCLIYEKTAIMANIHCLIASYRHQLAVMTDKATSDEQKQSMLLKQIPLQLGQLFLLIIKLVFLISPFICYIFVDSRYLKLGHNLIYQVSGILLSLASVLLYLALKKVYVQLHKGRKVSP